MSLFPDAVPKMAETEYRARQTQLDAGGRSDLRVVALIWLAFIAFAFIVVAGVQAVLP